MEKDFENTETANKDQIQENVDLPPLTDDSNELKEANSASDENDVSHEAASETDAPFFSSKTSKSKNPPPIKPRLHSIENYIRDNKYYDMTHKKRGIALVINHFQFKSMSSRNGTYKDLERVQNSLKKLDFEVIVKNELKYSEVKKTIEEVSQMDHSNNDCFVCVIMTHGDKDTLWAYDKKYPVEHLYEPFYGDQCQSLIGKPKLFFIQACRGQKVAEPVQVRSLTMDYIDSSAESEKAITYSIPSMADLLVMYSTYEGHYSFRNPDTGSFFIQSLCTELDLNGKIDDLLTILTAVSRRVAYEYQSNIPGNPKMHEKKQMPTIVTMLTKILYFTPKQ
uniref:CSON015591 protein n=1 Tax=Culicoides sonorensis TaxID=179676 RepID=A0A336K6K2_CULSO